MQSSLLKLNAISEHFEEAIADATDYEGFLHQLLRMEVDAAEDRAKERKIKAARFPYRKYIEDLEVDLLPEGMRKRLNTMFQVLLKSIRKDGKSKNASES